MEETTLRARHAAGEFAHKKVAAEYAGRGWDLEAWGGVALLRQREAEEQRLQEEGGRRAQALRQEEVAEMHRFQARLEYDVAEARTVSLKLKVMMQAGKDNHVCECTRG